jgi:hypothetical protein
MTVCELGDAEKEKDPAAFTICVKMADVLAAKLLFPTYDAVIECDPAVSELVMNVACALPFRAPLPIWVVPSKKFTVPEGVPPELVTAAVNVTDWPTVEGLAEDVTVVVVAAAAALTCTETALDVLAAKLVSPR